MVKKVFNFILFGFVGLLLIILAALAISIFMESQESAREEEQLRETQVATYGDLLTLCENVTPGGVGDFAFDGAERPLILQTGSANAHDVHEMLGADRRPSNRAEVDVVICLPPQGEGQRVEIGRCPYEGVARVAVRYRVDPQITAIDPASGAVILSETVQGSEPPGCPFSIEERGDDEVVLGGSPSAQTLIDWIELQGVKDIAWGADLLSLCESSPHAEDPFAPLDVAELPKVLILEYNTQNIHQWMGELQADWLTTDPDEIEFVVCAPPIEEDFIDTVFMLNCEFMISSGQQIGGFEVIPVYQRVANTVIVDPSSGEVLTQLFVEGAAAFTDPLAPNSVGCPPTIGGDELDGILGDYPTGISFQGAFRRQFLTG